MAHINENYLKLAAGYLFPEIGRRVNAYAANNPEVDIIRLGIGDVVKGIPRPMVDAMKNAMEEMAHDESFQGYPPDQGQEWLREAIVENDFQSRGIHLDVDEIFVSDGAKCDSGNIQEIFGQECKIALTDPVYPVYCDSNVMAGRTGNSRDGRYDGLIYLPCTEENQFNPPFPKEHADVIYLCSPNNPTGTVMTTEVLREWIAYAKREKAVILFDAAYEGYITDSSIPHSIYEVEGGREVAIEFRSFSKSAGFTGIRCGYTVVPKDIVGYTQAGDSVDLHRLWARRHSTKFNGVAYPVQRGAQAVYSAEGQVAIKALINFYLENATIMRKELTKAGIEVYGGEHAPYLWLKTPSNWDSWEFFDYLLEKTHVVGTPGAGFGSAGEGYFRLSAFNHRDKIEQAMERISKLDMDQ